MCKITTFILWAGFICLTVFQGFSQTLPAGSPVFEEALRRKQLLGELDSSVSFNLRPLRYFSLINENLYSDRYQYFKNDIPQGAIQKEKLVRSFNVLPLQNTIQFNSGRPYGWGNGIMIPNVGGQNHTTAGVSLNFYVLHVQLQPEILWAQNRSWHGFPNDFPVNVTRYRFSSWNYGDNPERFGEGAYAKVGWGQSKISLRAGAFELGASTENIWWGPGQFNALIFSNNARGFKHLTLNTIKPAKTFLGSFEGQLLIGRLEPSGFPPSQHPELNEQYARELSPDWRYVNGLSVSLQPKWIPGFSVGLNRTFQLYNANRGNTFNDWFPVFEVFTKESLFEDGNTVDYDSKGQDQQVSVFGRYVLPRARAEFYFEYGRRDHAYNWREFTLNPEHARAYILGFGKLFHLPNIDKMIQVRAEMTQQQESVNRYVRYFGLTGGASWHTHARARGFTHYGESLGVGIGTGGSNVQTLEVAMVDGLNKVGIRLERLANQQDFYYKAFGQQTERQPWVDLSVGLLGDYQVERLVISGKLQFINGLNYQWQLRPDSNPVFPIGKNKFSIMAQAHFVYMLNE
ncbi:MAG TPA: capsule assembly Wzi family protein [Cyclobacteriaceae bacterium]|nr:capsule assembly Wzi family protein [Cyclobacteriaceae bacterium]